ncbi:MAG: sigma factor, partial [Terriglobales bacterium]
MSEEDERVATEVLCELVDLPQDSARRAQLRDRVIEGYTPLAQHLARRFANRGEPLEDLTQVANMGLINAVDRYNPEHGTEFASYAI